MTGRVPTAVRLTRLAPYLFIVPVVLLFAFPLAWLAMGTFRAPADLLTVPPVWWPSHWTLDNLRSLTSGQVDLARYSLNTAFLCVTRAFGTLLSSSLAAYAFTRLRFRGRNILFAVTLAVLILPSWSVLVPQYQLFDYLGWLGGFKPLVVPMFFGDPFTIFLLSQFMRSIPEELSEAARADGASEARIFVEVILPLMKPALAVAGLLSIIETYNDFFGQLIYLNDPHDYTLALAAFQFVKSHGVPDIGAVVAFTACATVPLVVLFFFAQRYLRQGVHFTGLND